MSDGARLAPLSTTRSILVAAAETVATAAVAAWVVGHGTLGAYAARIAFRDLPRAQAATTMTTIFHSFDKLIVVALALLAAATFARTLALGAQAGRSENVVAVVASLLLLGVGLAGVAWVHPAIEHRFLEGLTATPGFAALHKISERLAHVQALLALTLFGAFAWSHRRC